MLGHILIAIAALASNGLCMSIQDLPPRTFKEAYSRRNALQPSIHRTVDISNDINIAPRDNVTMYYAPAAGSEAPTAAFVTFSNMRYKTVSLEQVKSIADVTCEDNKINVEFSNADAYKQAQETWAAKGLSGLVLVSYQEGCGAAWPEQRSFLYMSSLSQKFTASTLTVSGKYKEMRPQFAAKNIDIRFGQFASPKQNELDSKVRAVMPGYDPSASYPFEFFPQQDSDTQFGKALSLYKYNSQTSVGMSEAGVYCIGCGAKGALKLTGHINVGLEGLSPKVNKLGVDMDLNMNARIALGVVGNVPPTGAIQQRLLERELGSFSIADIVAIKPSITVDFSGKADSKLAAGGMYGYELNWPALSAKIDIQNRKVDSSGATPDMKSISEYSGKADATLQAQPLIGITIAADVMMGQFQGKVVISDKPTIDITAKSADGCVKAGISNQLSVVAEVAKQTMTIPAIMWVGPTSSSCVGGAAAAPVPIAPPTAPTTAPLPPPPAADPPSRGPDSIEPGGSTEPIPALEKVETPSRPKRGSSLLGALGGKRGKNGSVKFVVPY